MMQNLGFDNPQIDHSDTCSHTEIEKNEESVIVE